MTMRLSYCTAKAFSLATVPLVEYRPQHIPALNDNQPRFVIRAAIHPHL